MNSDVVDALNAGHAAGAMTVTKSEAAEHLRRNGTAISQLVAGRTAGDLQAGHGRVERLAQIAIWHADEHRTEIEAALAAVAGRGRLKGRSRRDA